MTIARSQLSDDLPFIFAVECVMFVWVWGYLGGGESWVWREVAVQKGRQELKEEAREGGAKGALRGGGGRREWSFCSSHRGPAMFVLRRKTPQLTGQQHGIKCREYFEDNGMIS